MIGTQLARYSLDPFLVWDFESCWPSLNLAYARPWEISWALATLKGGIQSIQTRLIRWPAMVITEDNPSFKHFDWAHYNREARDPREVYAEFGPMLRKYRSVFHNGLGFDSVVEQVWRREIGLPVDYSWLYNPGVIDTNCISKAYRANPPWVPDISSPDSFLAWQYGAYHERLPKGPGGHAPKTKLGVMCAEFGLEYDEKRAHAADYDIDRNWAVFKELIWKVEI